MASAFMAAKLASRPVLAERARQQYARWELAALPARLRRNGLDHYYLSVWPGLEQLAPLAELPPRRAPVRNGYVHLPFCSGLCDFCSYFVLVGRDRADMARYVDDLLRDLALNQERAEVALTTLYLGGGTPSLLGPDLLARLLDGMRAEGALADGLIGTAELHPELFADPARAGETLDVLRGRGLGRVSLGLQSVDDELLAATNRRHGADFMDAALARLDGFRVNLDLMYGLPGQSLESWIATLEAALARRPGSLSTYFTFIDPGTALHHRVVRGEVALPAHELVQTQHIAAQLALEAAGYRELPNDFWTVTEGDFRQETLPSDANTLALGAGAYGYFAGVQFFNELSLAGYRAKLAAGRLPVWRGRRLSPAEELCRDVMFSLKNAPELDLARFAARHGATPLDSHPEVMALLDEHELVEADARALRLTPKGRLLVEEIACLFEPPGHHARRSADRRVRRHNFAPTYSRSHA
jgi:oxygen-independent coproporphyrinogen III oxidase